MSLTLVMDKQKEPSIADIQQEIDIMKEENDETKTQLMKLKKKMEEGKYCSLRASETYTSVTHVHYTVCHFKLSIVKKTLDVGLE